MKTLFQNENSSAHFSKCRKYRYRLVRDWSDGKTRTLNYLMLNPSVANEVQSDSTVTRCLKRAQQLGFNRVVVTNLFAYVSTDRSVLKTLDDPVGPLNDRWIAQEARQADLVICAWGNEGLIGNRSDRVRELLQGVPLHALVMTNQGEPGHPLYLSYDRKPFLISEDAE